MILLGPDEINIFLENLIEPLGEAIKDNFKMNKTKNNKNNNKLIEKVNTFQYWG